MSDARRKPVDYDELYPGRFLKSGAFAELERKPLTIADVDTDELEGDKGKKTKGTITFTEVPQQLVLNSTNGQCIKAMFGRTLRDWHGKRIALFISEWAGEPALRVWGSPDIERDIEVEVKLPRKRPIKMTMHAMQGPRAVKPAAPKPPGHSPEATALLKEMAAASSLEALMDIEADMAIREFSEQEGGVLARAIAKRRRQLEAATNGQ